MPGPLPLIIAGGVAAVLLGKKKKASRSEPKAVEYDACSNDATTRDGMTCRNGVLVPDIVDESMLEKYEQPTGPASGDFEIEEVDVSLSANEEVEQPVYLEEVVDYQDRCDEFLRAIYVPPQEEGDMPINEIAIDMTIIPAMKSVLLKSVAYEDQADLDIIGPAMVSAALAELVPTCEWYYDGSDFTFNDGHHVESPHGREILYALMDLCVELVDEYNQTEVN
jgi:hypothetical protein